MKSFKQYLTESKKVYEFKVKIAGELEGDAVNKIKLGLSKFQVESCSSGKRTPIQESPVDFPEHKNVNVTVFDVCLAYPTNSAIVRESIAHALGLTMCCVKVRNLKEEEEDELNHANDTKSGESLLLKDYEGTSAQDQVGEKQMMSLIKELSKSKHDLEQQTGINDEILAKSGPVAAMGPAASAIKQNNVSPVGSKQVKLPTAKTARG